MKLRMIEVNIWEILRKRIVEKERVSEMKMVDEGCRTKVQWGCFFLFACMWHTPIE